MFKHIYFLNVSLFKYNVKNISHVIESFFMYNATPVGLRSLADGSSHGVLPVLAAMGLRWLPDESCDGVLPLLAAVGLIRLADGFCDGVLSVSTADGELAI